MVNSYLFISKSDFQGLSVWQDLQVKSVGLGCEGRQRYFAERNKVFVWLMGYIEEDSFKYGNISHNW